MEQIKTIDDELAEYGLKIRYNDADNREPIDLSIEDGEDNVAWLWGANPHDVEWECNHPVVEYEDDETQGECAICGSYCDWHTEGCADESGDGYIERVPHNWYPRKSAGGILGEIIDYYKRTF